MNILAKGAAMFAIVALVSGCGAGTTSPSDNTDTMSTTTNGPTMTFNTTMGDIVIEMYTEQVPNTTANIMTLAKEGKYDGTIFHRVIENFMIQGGDYENRNGTGGQAAGGGNIDDEIVEGLSNVRGTLSMANRGVIAGKGTNGSQFFINQKDNVYLDGKHTVFGKVVEGMDVVDAIAKVEKDNRDKPLTDVEIVTATVSE